MDREGRDRNITSQQFGSLAYGHQIQSNTASAATVTSPEDFQDKSTIISLPSDPDKVYVVDLDDSRLNILDTWTQGNKYKEIVVPNFRDIVTGSDETVQITISATELPTVSSTTTTTSTTSADTPTTQNPTDDPTTAEEETTTAEIDDTVTTADMASTIVR